MQLPLAAVALCFGGAIAVGIADIAKGLPSCAHECVTSIMGAIECAPTDLACICTDPAFTVTAEDCIFNSCSIRESLVIKNATTTACGAPGRDRGRKVTVGAITGLGVAVVVFSLRMLARLPCYGGQFGWDDWTAVVTMALVIPFSIILPVMTRYGLGEDMWTVPPDTITHLLYIYYFEELLYLTIIALTKISILFLYLRLFPDEMFRIATKVIMGLNVCYIIIFDVITALQCNPISGAWLHWDGEGNYHCRNLNAQGWAAAAINMILDLMVMILPLRDLYRLHLSWRKKLYVMVIFSLGIFVTLVSIIRLESLIRFGATRNVTWDYADVAYWSAIEMHVGIICACLPAIRSLLRRIWPQMFGDTLPQESGGSGSMPLEEGTIALRPKHNDSEAGGGQFIELVDMNNSSQASLMAR